MYSKYYIVYAFRFTIKYMLMLQYIISFKNLYKMYCICRILLQHTMRVTADVYHIDCIINQLKL